MEFLIILGLIFLNGLLSMSEMAVVSALKKSLDNEAKQGGKSAAAALKLINGPDKFLSTVQVGITLIGLLTGLYSGDVLASKVGPVMVGWGMSPGAAFPLAKVLIVIVVTYLSIVLGELTPKRIGLSSAERVSKMIARPMHVLSVIVSPFVWILAKSTTGLTKLLGIKAKSSNVTEEEIKFLIREGKKGGEVQEVEQSIMERVFVLGDRNMESVMTHRNDVVWIDASMTREQIKALIADDPFNKYPVADRDLDNVVGVVYLKDLFMKIEEPGFDLKTVVRPADFFYENMEVYSALEKMKTNHSQFALISDEFGTVTGVVTMMDIMEALVGELPGIGEEPMMVRRDDGTYLFDGQCFYYDFLVYLNLNDYYKKYEYNTLSGLILAELGHIPKTGDKFDWHGYRMEIMDMDGARIDKVLVTPPVDELSDE